MYNVTIPVNTLSAMLQIAPAKDVRVYLNSIYIDGTRGNLVATDGAAMLVVRYDELRVAPNVIMPRTFVESVVKAAGRKIDAVDLSIGLPAPESEAHSLRCTVGNATLTGHALAGYTYPDYVRAIPSTMAPSMGTAGNYDPALVARVGKALATLAGLKTQHAVQIIQNGPDNTALAMLDESKVVKVAAPPPHVAVLMPCRQRDARNIENIIGTVRGILDVEG